MSLSGQPRPPRLPANAGVLAAGEVGAGHVVVIRRTMRRLERVEGLDAAVWGEAEAGLAQAATRLSPRGLEKVAARLLADLDPDGVAPDEREARHDEVRLVSRRDGSLWMTAVIADALGAEILREGFDAGWACHDNRVSNGSSKIDFRGRHGGREGRLCARGRS